MLKYSRLVVILCLLTFPSCCFTSTRMIESESRSAYLSFKPEVKEAKIFMYGEFIDFTHKYNANPQVLEISPGRHTLKVIDNNGIVVFDQDIYIDSGQLRIINLAIGNPL